MPTKQRCSTINSNFNFFNFHFNFHFNLHFQFNFKFRLNFKPPCVVSTAPFFRALFRWAVFFLFFVFRLRKGRQTPARPSSSLRSTAPQRYEHGFFRVFLPSSSTGTCKYALGTCLSAATRDGVYFAAFVQCTTTGHSRFMMVAGGLDQAFSLPFMTPPLPPPPKVLCISKETRGRWRKDSWQATNKYPPRHPPPSPRLHGLRRPPYLTAARPQASYEIYQAPPTSVGDGA